MSYQAPPEQGDTIDLRDYLRTIWLRRWLILLIVVVAAGGTYALTEHGRIVTTKQYVSTAKLYISAADPTQLISPTGAAQTPGPPDPQQLSDLGNIFNGTSVTQAAYKSLGLPVGSAGSISVAPSSSASTTGTSIVVVSATSRTPTLAARLANAYITAFLNYQEGTESAAANSYEKAVSATLANVPNTAANASERQSLEYEIAQLKAAASDPSSGAQVVDAAQVPTAPAPTASTSSKALRDAILGGVVGLLLGIGGALALGLFDRRLVRVSDIESNYHRQVLAVVPHSPAPTPVIDGRAVAAPDLLETFRSLRINLRLKGGDSPPRSVLVTSGVPSEGKSTVARDLALVYAEANERVLLVDADLRRPSIAGLLGIDAQRGLTHVLHGEASPGDVVVSVLAPREPQITANGHGPVENGFVHKPGSGSLDVLLHGDLLNNPAPLLATPAMATLLRTARERYDVVIIDTAPVLAVADTLPMLEMVDAVVLVARLGQATRDIAARVTEAVGNAPKANIIGVVANDMRGRFLGAGGYSGLYSARRGGYGYGYSSDTSAGSGRHDTTVGTGR